MAEAEGKRLDKEWEKFREIELMRTLGQWKSEQIERMALSQARACNEARLFRDYAKALTMVTKPTVNLLKWVNEVSAIADRIDPVMSAASFDFPVVVEPNPEISRELRSIVSRSRP